tara:strand:- start:604 stop:1239 length:636 start_codon:yes stop_codon:yes gene_type:complete
MNNFNISIFKNSAFSEILSEINFFSKYKINSYEDQDLFLKNSKKGNQVGVLFANTLNEYFIEQIKKEKLPSILLIESNSKKKSLHELCEELNIPFTIIEFQKKITSLIAKIQFKKNSLINLKEYIIDKNERKIKKNDQELQLSEKEIDFLVLFCENTEPVSRSYVLKNVWNYSSETETHTVETHIHRLRKKISEKFGDNNFIKNNKKGYYV